MVSENGFVKVLGVFSAITHVTALIIVMVKTNSDFFIVIIDPNCNVAPLI
ncbi:MAG: hypothetical protein QW219_00490 [Fervidicoccaceae archaeon]